MDILVRSGLSVDYDGSRGIVLFKSREHEDLHVEGVENRVTKACRSGGKHWREGEWKSAEARQSSRT